MDSEISTSVQCLASSVPTHDFCSCTMHRCLFSSLLSRKQCSPSRDPPDQHHSVMEPFAAAQGQDPSYSTGHSNYPSQIRPQVSTNGLQTDSAAFYRHDGNSFPGMPTGQDRDYDFNEIHVNGGDISGKSQAYCQSKGGSFPSANYTSNSSDKLDFQEVSLPTNGNESQNFPNVGSTQKSSRPLQLQYQQQSQLQREIRHNLQDVYIDPQHMPNIQHPSQIVSNNGPPFPTDGAGNRFSPQVAATMIGSNNGMIPSQMIQSKPIQEPYGNIQSSTFRQMDGISPSVHKRTDQSNPVSPGRSRVSMNMDPYASQQPRNGPDRSGGAMSPTSIPSYPSQLSQAQKYPFTQQQQQQQHIIPQKRQQVQALPNGHARRLSVKPQGFSGHSSQVTTPYPDSFVPTPVLQNFSGTNAQPYPPNVKLQESLNASIPPSSASLPSQQHSQRQLSQQTQQPQLIQHQVQQRYQQQQQQPIQPSQSQKYHQYNYDSISSNMQGSPQPNMRGSQHQGTPAQTPIHPSHSGVYALEMAPSDSAASIQHPTHQQPGVYGPHPPASEQQQDFRHAMGENPLYNSRDYLMSDEVKKNLSNIAIVRFLRFTDLMTCRHEKPNLPYLRQLVTEFFQDDACMHIVLKTATESRSFKLSCYLLPTIYFKYLEKVQMFEFTQKFLRATVMPNLSAIVETDHFSFKCVFEDGSYCNHFGTIRIQMNSSLKFEELELITDYNVTGVEFAALEKFMNDFAQQNKISPNIDQIQSHFNCVGNLTKFGLRDDLMRMLQVGDVMTLSKPLMDFFIRSGSGSITESFRLFNEMNMNQFENGVDPLAPFPDFEVLAAQHQRHPLQQQMGLDQENFSQHPPSTVGHMPYPSHIDSPASHVASQVMKPPSNPTEHQLQHQMPQNPQSRARSHQNSITSIDKTNLGKYPDTYDEMNPSSLSQATMKNNSSSGNVKPVAQVVSASANKKFKLQAPPTPTALKKRRAEGNPSLPI